MSRFAWFEGFNDALRQDMVMIKHHDDISLKPARLLILEDVEDWSRVAQTAKKFGCRWAGIWGDTSKKHLIIRCLFEFSGDYVAFQTSLPLSKPIMSSHTPVFEGANRMERHLMDMYGVVMLDHPDIRRWTRHSAWAEDQFPLREEFPVAGKFQDAPRMRTPADADYPMQPILGAGVYQIPVGPVHAGIIEPGHFRFHAVGENILSLEQRLGYVHKGMEKIAHGRDAHGLAKLAARVSGDSAVAHAWAACQAMERAQKCAITRRSDAVRAIAAERERIGNHLGDIGAVCNDVGFAFAYMQFGRLRELWLRENEKCFNHRLLMDCVVPGGVAKDLSEEDCQRIKLLNDYLLHELKTLSPIVFDHPSLDDRLLETGVLSVAQAKALGVVGYVGKASGQDFDARRDHVYSPYDGLHTMSPLSQSGDVAARLQIRVEEIHHSLNLIEELIANMPADGIARNWPDKPLVGQGIGIIEGWRGETFAYVRFDNEGRVARYFPRDPSWFSWPALEQLIHGNIVPDFPVCNKSVNGSYSGHDL